MASTTLFALLAIAVVVVVVIALNARARVTAGGRTDQSPAGGYSDSPVFFADSSSSSGDDCGPGDAGCDSGGGSDGGDGGGD